MEGVTGRTGGVPLFVEEVTRLLLEGGAQTIPPTLQLSLAARLDRLGDAREIAQFGAVLGREFAHSLLRSVAVADGRSSAGWIGDPALQSALDRLAEADVLFVEGIHPRRLIASSTPSSRTRPTRASSRADARLCIAMRRRRSLQLPARSPSWSPIISRKPARPISRSSGGARPATLLLNDRRFRKPLPIWQRQLVTLTRPLETAPSATTSGLLNCYLLTAALFRGQKAFRPTKPRRRSKELQRPWARPTT